MDVHKNPGRVRVKAGQNGQIRRCEQVKGGQSWGLRNRNILLK
jgi:hypothetical protein